MRMRAVYSASYRFDRIQKPQEIDKYDMFEWDNRFPCGLLR